MHATTAVRNPFVMLTDPEALLSAIEASAPLKSLHGRVCRPLDRVVVPKSDDNASAAFDAQVESEPAPSDADAA